jgi:hypothetical protein
MCWKMPNHVVDAARDSSAVGEKGKNILSSAKSLKTEFTELNSI